MRTSYNVGDHRYMRNNTKLNYAVMRPSEEDNRRYFDPIPESEDLSVVRGEEAQKLGPSQETKAQRASLASLNSTFATIFEVGRRIS